MTLFFPVGGRTGNINLKCPGKPWLRSLKTISMYFICLQMGGWLAGNNFRHQAFSISLSQPYISEAGPVEKRSKKSFQGLTAEALRTLHRKTHFHGSDLLGCDFNTELIFKLQLDKFSWRSCDEPDAISVLGIIVGVVRGGHVACRFLIMDVDGASTGC